MFDVLSNSLIKITNDPPDTYAFSASYYWTTGRYGLRVFQDRDSLVVACVHPHVPNCQLVFPAIGTENQELTQVVIEWLYECGLSLSIPQTIKLGRFSEQGLVELQNLLVQNSSYKLVVGRTAEKYLDWAYPVRLLDTSNVANLIGKKYQKIRTKIRGPESCVAVRPINFLEDHNILIDVVRCWQLSSVDENSDESTLDYYQELISVSKFPSSKLEGLAFFINAQLVGFCVWETVTLTAANSLANLCLKTIAGLSEFQMRSLCQKLVESGVTTLNLGGSETDGLDRYKRKFCPTSSVDLFSGIVSSNLTKIPNVTLGRISSHVTLTTVRRNTRQGENDA